MIKQASLLTPDIPFYRDDMRALSLKEASLSGIAAFYAIVNYEMNVVKKVFAEFHRVLKKDGILLLAFHTGENEVLEVKRFFGRDIKLGFTLFRPDDILKRLEHIGFTIEEAIIRYPYRDEHQTKRAYILARK
jgi:ubiquinone/menaquinone biosynthesis C-methylase UbiE